MKHVAFAEAEIKKSALDRACGPLKIIIIMMYQDGKEVLEGKQLKMHQIAIKIINEWKE